MKFFRKIRQRLLVNEKISKYLFYAIGEIILVVIGIVLALQVNNWNENRKVRNNEVNLLIELQSDLKFNLHEMVDLSKSLSSRISAANQIITNTRLDTIAMDTVKKWFEDIYENSNFNSPQNVYQKMLNSDNQLITNPKIREWVTDLYEFKFRNIHINQENEKQIQHDEYFPAVLGCLQYTPCVTSQNINYCLNYPKNEFEDLRKGEFMSSLVHLNYQRQVNYFLYTRWVVFLEEVMQEVDKEILLKFK